MVQDRPGHRPDESDQSRESNRRIHTGSGFLGQKWRDHHLRLGRVPQRLIRLHLKDGREETLHTLARGVRFAPPDPVASVSSVDGSVAFVQGQGKTTSLEILRPDGSVEHVIRNEADEAIRQVVWLPTNRSLLFTRVKTSPSLPPEARWPALWRIDLETRAVRPLGIAMDGLRDLSLSYDGRRLAFTAGWPTREAWVLENFLPVPPPKPRGPASQSPTIKH